MKTCNVCNHSIRIISGTDATYTIFFSILNTFNVLRFTWFTSTVHSRTKRRHKYIVTMWLGENKHALYKSSYVIGFFVKNIQSLFNTLWLFTCRKITHTLSVASIPIYSYTNNIPYPYKKQKLILKYQTMHKRAIV